MTFRWEVGEETLEGFVDDEKGVGLTEYELTVLVWLILSVGFHELGQSYGADCVGFDWWLLVYLYFIIL